MAKRHNALTIHEQATDLMIKSLQLDTNTRISLVATMLQDSELNDAQHKKIHELVRKACEARDKIAISLFNVDLVDPRQLPLDFSDVTPEDFR